MALSCPLADQVGTAADWSAVVVAFVAAVAVFMVSRSANANARVMRKIQAQEASDRRAANAREARLLLVHIEPELRYVQPQFALILLSLYRCSRDRFIDDQVQRAMFEARIRDINLPVCEALLSRWHVLSDQDALDVARMTSSLSTLKLASANAARVNLSISVPTVSKERLDEFQREVLSNSYEEIVEVSSGLNSIMLRVLDAATASGINAAASPATPPSASSSTLQAGAISTSGDPD